MAAVLFQPALMGPPRTVETQERKPVRRAPMVFQEEPAAICPPAFAEAAPTLQGCHREISVGIGIHIRIGRCVWRIHQRNHIRHLVGACAVLPIREGVLPRVRVAHHVPLILLNVRNDGAGRSRRARVNSREFA